MRQGTEGFYLQIVAEMKKMGSLIIPYHGGVPHFSKPPLGFWLALPMTNIIGLEILYGARLAILLSSLIMFFLIARTVSKHLHFGLGALFIFTLSCFGAVKYSRIFMLESPLALLGTLAAVLLYDALKRNSYRVAILAGAALGLAGLTKGPVSFVMAGLSLFIYFGICRRFPRKQELLLLFASLVSSLVVFLPWFLILGAKFGSEFWDYFLMRENVGKFTSKSYPITVLFQGLFLFLLPWSFIFLNSIRGINHRWMERAKSERSFLIYLLAFGLGHFLIWFIPSQRSHHYAYPSTFFFLFVAISLLREAPNLKRVILSVFGLTYLLLAYLSFTFSFPWVLPFVLGALMLGFGIKSRTRFFVPLWSLGLLSLWYVIAPKYAYPILPERIQAKIGMESIAVSVRKPFFIREELGRPIHIVPYKKIGSNHIVETYFLTDQFGAQKLPKLTNYEIVEKYQVWKRNAKLGEIFEAIKVKNLNNLKSDMYLLQKN